MTVSSPPCVEKQLLASTRKQNIVLLNGTDSKTYLIQLELLPHTGGELTPEHRIQPHRKKPELSL